jgi:hypothetical protein
METSWTSTSSHALISMVLSRMFLMATFNNSERIAISDG